MKIHPKTNEYLEGIEAMSQYIEQEKGIEIQYFHKNKDELVDFEAEKPIRELMEKFPNLEEITVHPPLAYYDIELLLFRKKDLLYSELQKLIDLSNEYGIKINIIYHTLFTIQSHRLTTLDDIKEIGEFLRGTKVKIFLENIYMMNERDTCTVLDLCEAVDSPNIKACIDICHIYCQAKIWYTPMKEFIKGYLDKEKCKKYVGHIHFSETKNDDGYLDRKTHGRSHDTIEKLFEDADILREYGMTSEDINWVTEISELDYILRPDQISEIKGLIQYRKKLA